MSLTVLTVVSFLLYVLVRHTYTHTHLHTHTLTHIHVLTHTHSHTLYTCTHTRSSLPTVPPSILSDPVDVIAIDQESVMFTCLAISLPAPGITWIITPPLPTPPTITNTPGEEEGEVESVLVFLATSSLNQTSVVCVASNNGGMSNSSSATLIIGGG